MEENKAYKVFISYSWTTPQHEKWVNVLAERLQTNGILVKYDKWDLKHGQDKYKFMESMVKDSDIDRVLIICDKGYKEKSDTRIGGVGTETQIITPEIYSGANQEKFIPIIAEKGESFDSYIPIYLRARIGIDLSSEELYEDKYEELLRMIFEKPVYRRPKLGTPPSYIFDDKVSNLKIDMINRQLKNAIINKPNQVSYLISDFLEEFVDSLKMFEIKNDDLEEPYDEVIYSKIIEMTELRNDYVEFLSILGKTQDYLDIDIIITLFENIYRFVEFQGVEEVQFDNYKFFIHELFLYTVAVLIDNKLFDKLNVLLSTKYFVNSKYNHINSKGVNFTQFRRPIDSIENYRNERLKLNKINLVAEMVMQRVVVHNKSYKQLLYESDLLLHYISIIKFKDHYNSWFPITYIYAKLGGGHIDTLRKMVRKSHFEKAKVLFDVKNLRELVQCIDSFENQYKGYERVPSRILHLSSYVDVEELKRQL